MNIKVSEFSETPSGRYASDGPQSGEIFRENILRPAIDKLKDDEKLHIKIDEVEGYGSSFLEEAFGGLIRKRIIEREKLLNILSIEYDDSYFRIYKDRIISYINDAKPE